LLPPCSGFDCRRFQVEQPAAFKTPPSEAEQVFFVMKEGVIYRNDRAARPVVTR
jgi:hypothetical protein